MKKIVIAGTMSGSGKTTISSILMSAFENVAPFKVGPDYIDPGYHELFTGNKSNNLDVFMIGEEALKYVFEINSRNKDISIVEGVMGLYDGLGHEKDNFSTAHVARILDIPVILVVNAKAISTSIAAVIDGFKNFDKNVEIKGVILNNVSSENLYLNLKEAVERYTGIECVGYLPKNEELFVESRHLGLKQAFEISGDEKSENRKADIQKNLENRKNEILKRKELFREIGKKYFDLDKIYSIAKEFEPTKNMDNFELIKDLKNKYAGKKVSIAKDAAFSFYYEMNIELLKFSGFEIIEFSPIFDEKLPENVDFVYIGGGYPELYAKGLMENISMKKSIIDAFEKGTKIYAECGGFMYLADKLHLSDGKIFDFCGIFDIEIKMREKLNIGRFGYINIETENGINLRGHEFHYSEILRNGEISDSDKEKSNFYKIWKNNGRNWQCGYKKNHALAGYPHVSFFSNIEFFKFLMEEL